MIITILSYFGSIAVTTVVTKLISSTSRSTRHFGALTFFLVWNKNIDNLLVDLIETLHIDEAKDLVTLYQLVHSSVKFQGENPVEVVQDYIKKAATKKGVLELAIQAYKEVATQKEALEKGIRAAHGNAD